MNLQQLASNPDAFWRNMKRIAMDQGICDYIADGMDPGDAADLVEYNMWQGELNPPPYDQDMEDYDL